MYYYLISTFLFIIGAVLGSFVNVVSLRYSTGLSFIRGKSRCLSCNRELSYLNLIPLFSFLFLKGRCAYCKSRFSVLYFLVELLSGSALVLLYTRFNFSFFQFFLLSIIYCLLSVIFLYDLRHKIIPDFFVYSFILVSFVYSYFNLSFFPSLLASILVPLPFFLIWFFSQGRLMGFGDIKLMAGMGAFLGLAVGFSAVSVSFWIGATYVIILLILKRKLSMKSEVPFAPFLVLGTILTFLFDLNLFKF